MVHYYNMRFFSVEMLLSLQFNLPKRPEGKGKSAPEGRMVMHNSPSSVKRSSKDKKGKLERKKQNKAHYNFKPGRKRQ